MGDALERRLGDLERDTLGRSGVGDWLAAAEALRALLRDAPDDVRLAVLAMVAPIVELDALRAVVSAFELGRADAARILGAGYLGTPLAGPSRASAAPVRGLDAAGSSAVARAQRLARAGADAAAIAAPVLGFARSLRAGVSDAINRGAGDAVRSSATAARVAVVWVAETNACVHCLALSGTIAPARGAFSSSATYGRKAPPVIGGPLRSPPRHPYCRCTLEPLVAPEYAAALRREADRSVLRGFSLESESMAVRVDAAERLIAGGVDAPKSVIAFSRRAVRAGRFPTRGRPGE